VRKKLDFRTGSKDTYFKFCSKHPDINISHKEWNDITYMYSKLARDYILETGRSFRFPRGVGEFVINKKKVKKIIKRNGKDVINLPIDWKKSKEKGKRIYLMNHHTEGFVFSWRWMKETSKVKFAPLWKFRIHRNSSRLLANCLKSGKGYHNKYCEWFKS